VPEVIAPIDGTPAAEAGVEPGDRITKIDAQSTTGMDVEEIVKRLRGAPGTKVNLTISRNDKAPFDLTLVRTVIHVVSVKSDLKGDDIGYIRIAAFTESTPAELANAISRLRDRAHGRLNGLILDLRNDPGGLLDAAVEVSGDFIDGGVVVTTRGRTGQDDHVYRAPATGDLLRGTPVVVLINSASASAAEIVAGALQDHHRATVMGTRSFGKGSVQTIIPLEGQGALRLTTALYYTPSGRSIQGQGIAPDIIVSLPKSQQVANALVTYESDLYRALKKTPARSPRGPPRLLPPRSRAAPSKPQSIRSNRSLLEPAPMPNSRRRSTICKRQCAEKGEYTTADLVRAAARASAERTCTGSRAPTTAGTPPGSKDARNHLPGAAQTAHILSLDLSVLTGGS